MNVMCPGNNMEYSVNEDLNPFRKEHMCSSQKVCGW